jgi:hypothetical protein
MAPEQNNENASGAEEDSAKTSASSGHGLIGHVAKLLGKTAGLAQATGAKTADRLLATGKQARKILKVPSKLRSLVSYGTQKERKAEMDFEMERLGRRIAKLYTRIGERICHSPLIDRVLLSADPQMEALVSTLRDLEAEVAELQQQERIAAGVSPPPSHEGSESAAGKMELPREGGSQAIPSSESSPSPAPEEGKGQSSQTE